jgi:hypothetical protein
MTSIDFGTSLYCQRPSVYVHAESSAYPLTVSVQSSHITMQCGRVVEGGSQCDEYLVITALVNGHHLELEGGKAKQGRLALGDYKAKLVSDKNKKTYFSQQVYEIQYPDGATEKFTVTGESK